MNLIIRCPGCNKPMLAMNDQSIPAAVDAELTKPCPKCKKNIEVKVQIEAKVVDGAKKE